MRIAFVTAFMFCWVTDLNAQAPKLVLPVGHTGGLNSATFSTDGKRCVTTARDNTVKIWQSATGTLLFSIELKPDKPDGDVSPLFAQFSPDGKKLAVGTVSDLRVYDAITGNLERTLISDEIHVKYCSFSSDGKKMVSTSFDKLIIWDFLKGTILNTLEGHSGRVFTAKFNNDGSKILSASSDKTAKLWDVASGKLILTFEGHEEQLTDASFSNGEEKIATSSWDYTVKIWNAVTGKEITAIKKFEYIVSSVAFSKDDIDLVIAERDRRTVVIRNAATGDLVKHLSGHTDQANGATYSTDGKYIITPSEDNTGKIWESASGKILSDLKSYTSQINSATYSADGKYILTSSIYDSTTKLWDASTGKIIHYYQGNRDQIRDPHFSPDGKKIVGASLDGNTFIWDVNSEKKELQLSGHTNSVFTATYSPDGKKILTASSDRTARLWNAITGKLLFIFTLNGNNFEQARFSHDGAWVIVPSSTERSVSIWNAGTGKLYKNFITKISASSAEFSPDDKKILICGYNETTVLDALTGDILLELKQDRISMSTAHFSKDGKMIITSSCDGTSRIWNAITGKILQTLSGHTHCVASAEFSPNGEKAVTTAWDNTAKIWDVKTGRLLYTFLTLDSTGYLNLLPNKYYMSVSRVSKLLKYITIDQKVISFEQLDVKYNRPDKVLEAIGNTDTALIKSYRKAWEKRIKKLGIDTTAFRDGYSVPEADFTNRDGIEYEQKTGTLRLQIKGIDSTYKLDRFNVWVNEAPVYGQRGISIRKRNKNDFDTTITIKLSQGENRIEASITNVNGTESYRMPLTVNYIPVAKQKEMIRFTGIGIDQFTDSKYDLQYSAKDIRDLSAKLKEKYKDDIIIDTLFNENVTVSNVKALKQKLQQTTENDKVIIAYSGHGMLSKDFDYYLSTYNVNFDKPEQEGLPYEELENLLDSIPARKKLMLIDACHSGEVDKEDLITLNASSDSLIKGFKPVAYKKDGQLGLKNSFELMQSLFVNVGKSTGATIISAAAGTQFALERNDLKNGVFTYAILEAMNKYPNLKISELKKIVGERVEQLTKGLQKPTSRNETIAVDWNVW